MPTPAPLLHAVDDAMIGRLAASISRGVDSHRVRIRSCGLTQSRVMSELSHVKRKANIDRSPDIALQDLDFDKPKVVDAATASLSTPEHRGACYR